MTERKRRALISLSAGILLLAIAAVIFFTYRSGEEFSNVKFDESYRSNLKSASDFRFEEYVEDESTDLDEKITLAYALGHWFNAYDPADVKLDDIEFVGHEDIDNKYIRRDAIANDYFISLFGEDNFIYRGKNGISEKLAIYDLIVGDVYYMFVLIDLEESEEGKVTMLSVIVPIEDYQYESK